MKEKRKLDPVAAHLCDEEQRKEISTLGMWLFLSTEVLFFGGLFVGFAIYRSTYAADFIAASGHLKVYLGGINTLVLLTSSFFVALAVLAARKNERQAVTRNLLITIALAVLFLAIKGYEWFGEYQENLVPGVNFSMPNIDPTSAAHQQLFMIFYFIMTGIHGIHMLAGTGVMAWITWRSKNGRGDLSQTELIRIESTALYWHFVDVMWIFLLPLLYLTGLEKL